MPKYNIHTLVTEIRTVEAANAKEAFEINNNADDTDFCNVMVTERFAVPLTEDGKENHDASINECGCEELDG